MQTGYKRIGDYIELVDERNKDLSVDLLLGLSISKEFIPSVANTVGSNMRNYKIIRKGQFACSIMQVRRDKKMPVALLQDHEIGIISQAYPVFKVKDETELLPKYLMMWFSRPEFDREACFYAVGGVRGSLEWEDFCNMQLPVPTIEKQREIVAEYNTVVNRIQLNQRLNQKLEETAQAIYRRWFVEFEFPISKEQAAEMGKPELEGKPYQSSGGKLVWNEELGKDVPEGWEYGNIGNISTQFSGFAFKGSKYSFTKGIAVVRGENVTEKGLRWDTIKKWEFGLDNRMQKCFLNANDIVIGMDGSKVGKNWALISEFDLPLLLAQRVTSVRGQKRFHAFYIYLSLHVLRFEEYVSQVQTGTSVPHISGKQIENFPLIIPNESHLRMFDNVVRSLLRRIFLNVEASKRVEEFKNLLLSKMTKVEALIEKEVNV